MDWQGLSVFLVQAVVISLSGVLAPGPMMAATLAAGTRRRHAGAFVALGHAVIEFPLMILIVVGVGRVFEHSGVKIGIGLAGGVFLLWMGSQMLRDLRASRGGGPETADPGLAPAGDPAGAAADRHPFWSGVVLSVGNPYFLLWWATVGLGLATQAVTFGIGGFAIFAVAHWLCDLLWLEAVSLAVFSGSRILGPRGQRIILAVCGAAMIFFGIKFVWGAAAMMF